MKPIKPVWSWLPGEKETLDERYRDGFMIVDFESGEVRDITNKEMHEFNHMEQRMSDTVTRVEVPIDEYHASDRLSCSKISTLRESTLLFHERYHRGKWSREPTAAMQKGQLIEDMLATSESIKEYVPCSARRGSKQWRDMEEMTSHHLVKEDDWECAATLRSRIEQNPNLANAFWGTERQVSLLGEMYGQPFQVRYDFLDHATAYDLKHSAEFVPGPKLDAHIYRFGWHRQAWAYREMLRRWSGYKDAQFYLILAQKEPPYSIDIRPLDEDLFELGRREIKEAIHEYETCKATGNWDPAFVGRMIPIEQPRWTKDAPTTVTGDLIA